MGQKFLQALGYLSSRRPFIRRHMVRKSALRKKTDNLSSNSQGRNTAPSQSRADYPEAIAKLSEMKKEAVEAGYKCDPIIRRDLQIRQRQGQPFQKHHEPPTGHATTGTTDLYTSSTEKPVAFPADHSSSCNKWWQSSPS